MLIFDHVEMESCIIGCCLPEHWWGDSMHTIVSGYFWPNYTKTFKPDDDISIFIIFPWLFYAIAVVFALLWCGTGLHKEDTRPTECRVVAG